METEVAITGPRGVARGQISTLLWQWEQIVETTPSEKEFLRLSNKTSDELRLIFDSDSIAQEFQRLLAHGTDQNKSSFERREILKSRAADATRFLKSLSNRIEMLPESRKIAGGFR